MQTRSHVESPLRVLVISQVFPPDPAAVGQCLNDVCEALRARDCEVTVVTSQNAYLDGERRYQSVESSRAGEIVRVGGPSHGRRSLFSRTLGGLDFLSRAVARGLVHSRVDVVLVSTSPPMAAIAGIVLKLRHRARLIYWLMDLNPDQAVAAGAALPTSIPVRLMEGLNRAIRRHATVSIVLDDAMAERYEAKGSRSGDLAVIAPWGGPPPDGDDGYGPEQFRADHALRGKFVVMYSGNHSLVHPLATVLAAADQLAADDRFRFVFVGGGAGKEVVRAALASNIIDLPYQPRERLGGSLGAADLHIVTMGDNMIGIVHPSKIYGILALGTPVLYTGPGGSHVDAIVTEADIGWSVRHGDVAGTVEAIRRAAALSPDHRRSIALRSRESLSRDFTPSILVGRVAQCVTGSADTHLAKESQ
jgi:colanic acid biosynthesis glycosyl transferase WcaI